MKHYSMILLVIVLTLSILAGCSRRDMPMETETTITPSITESIATLPATQPTQTPETTQRPTEVPGESVDQSGTTGTDTDLARGRRMPAMR